MVLDPRKRRKKLERRAAKEKAKKKALSGRDPRNVAARIERAATAPILHCCTAQSLWTRGMAHVLLSRELETGSVAYVVFLVDVYCLGVKDVTLGVAARSRYDWQIYDKLSQRNDGVKLRPECARKLIEGAVDYARDLGLPPHPDYAKARLIFGEIDAGACPEQFVYGNEGKPYFVAGPYDSESRCAQIIARLTARCGPGGFDYLVPIVRAGMPDFDARMLESDDEEEEEEEA